MRDIAVPTVARIIVDLDVPHLDRPFDYAIPEHMLGRVHIGSLVRVKWGGRRINGWVVGLALSSDHDGELSPLLRILSAIPLFTADMLTTYRYLAARFAVNLSQILSLAIPIRRQKVEEELGPVLFPLPSVTDPSSNRRLGTADSQRLQRSVVQVVPHQQLDLLFSTFADSWATNTPLIVTAPTLFVAKQIRRALSDKFPNAAIGFQASELPHASRYETHLRSLRGEYVAVIGTRAAAWTPFPVPSVLAIWEDGSEHYRERRAPNFDILDIAVARVRWERFGLVAASYSRSVKSQMLVQSEWAESVEPDPHAVRQNVPRIQVTDPDAFEREGISALSVLPDAAFRTLREGLKTGPVLVQAMGIGRFVVLPCTNCRSRWHCEHCGVPLQSRGALLENAIACSNCGRPGDLTRCPACGAGPARTLEVGADRTARELGLAFPDVPVVISSSTTKIRRRIRSIPQIVVATAGAEPQVRDGYAAVVILEAERLAYSGRLDAEAAAARRWFSTFALGRPRSAGLLAGQVPDRLSSALVRWRPVQLAGELLSELRDVGFYPARWVVGLRGQASAVRSVLAKLESGEYALDPSEPRLVVLGLAEGSLESESEQETSAVISCETAQAMSLMHHLKTIANQRSLRRQPKVRFTVDPHEFLD